MPRKKPKQDFSINTYGPLLRKPLILKIASHLSEKFEPNVFILMKETNENNYSSYRIYLSGKNQNLSIIPTAGIPKFEQALKKLSESNFSEGNFIENEKEAIEIIRKELILRYRIGHKELSENEIKKLQEIEKKYNFQENNLIDEIYNLDHFIAGIKSTKQQLPSPSQKKIHLSELNKIIKKMMKLLADKKFNSKNINVINDYLDLKVYQTYIESKNSTLFHKIKDKLRYFYRYITSPYYSKNIKKNINVKFLIKLTKILDQLTSCLDRTGVQIICELNNALPITDNVNDTFVSSVEYDLKDLLNRCIKVLPTNIRQGRPFKSIIKNAIVKLLDIYENGTGKTPILYYAPEKKPPYAGEFYFFIQDCFSILKILLPRGTTSEIIAEATRKDMIQYYKKLKKISIP